MTGCVFTPEVIKDVSNNVSLNFRGCFLIKCQISWYFCIDPIFLCTSLGGLHFPQLH